MSDRLPDGSVPHVGVRTFCVLLVNLVVERATATALVFGNILDRENLERAGAAILGHELHRFVAVAPDHVLARAEQLLHFHFTPRLVELSINF